MQLLRVSGTAIQLVTNPESYAHNEDPKNLMPWASDSSIKIDRFDGRALLDYLPSATTAMIESGLQIERDEDGIGNDLRFERWHDLVDKSRLHVSEEQCLIENEEEWNDLVARHHALIGRMAEKKRESSEGTANTLQFGYNYGTETVEQDHGSSRLGDRELTALEEENILDHLDDLSVRDRDYLDALGTEHYIDDYYRLLRCAKAEEDARIAQLKITAVNLERTLAGKKPLKASEMEGIMSHSNRRHGFATHARGKRRGRTGRSTSPAHRSTRRSSPSYEPYEESSSRSGSESPPKDNVEFIVEFQSSSAERNGDVREEDEAANAAYRDFSSERRARVRSGAGKGSSDSNSQAVPSPVKMSLAEMLKQRMRQGLDQSIRSKEMKRQAKERELELAQVREKGDIPRTLKLLEGAESNSKETESTIGMNDHRESYYRESRGRSTSRNRKSASIQ
ncbi:hypothetical protein BGX28_000896, partial [Mortierella sp. GBA30]